MNLEAKYYHRDWLPYWMPNASVSRCNICKTEFTLFNRKHHCRKCGKIFCKKCWGKYIYVRAYHKRGPVCDVCYGTVDY